MKRSRFLAVLSVFTLLGASLALSDGGANHQAKQTPPVQMGTSGGSIDFHSNAFCCGGTLGSLVTRDGVLSILSNNHILARSGSAVVGEDILQPGLIDTGCNGANSNIVGDFAGDLVLLGTANVDAAIATARSNVDGTGTIIDIGVPCSNTQTVTVGLPVMKSGRTTGFTTNTVQAVDATVSVRYQKGCGQGRKFTITYTNQILTGNMSAGGDSGSLLVSNDGTPNPVGLLYAGSSSVTVHNPVQDVVNAFSAGGHTFGFVGNACASSAATAFGFGPTGAEVAFASMVKERYVADLMWDPAVVGVGVGTREDNPNEAAIVVYLLEGRPLGRHIPTDLDGVTVRIVRTDPIVAQ